MSDDGFQPGRWYRILQPDGELWMETSDPDEVHRESQRTGWPVERLYERHESEWRADETEKP
ncbi:hypothetical protein [Nocardia vulneris]|uniref:Uncharacterized protein n=1 Tax=Nocardia vulneris TaxID=1141657 RepID=A0ABR4ZCM2_9NOCA|nr:hypothetical protein [Nocardia vulneris]KIA63016.1 hypothetical protein FG87_21875 [Nocardia vulneris]